MTRSEAEGVLQDIEGVLQLISRYHQLSEDQRLAIHSRSGEARKKIEDASKLLRKLDKPRVENPAN